MLAKRSTYNYAQSVQKCLTFTFFTQHHALKNHFLALSQLFNVDTPMHFLECWIVWQTSFKEPLSVFLFLILKTKYYENCFFFFGSCFLVSLWSSQIRTQFHCVCISPPLSVPLLAPTYLPHKQARLMCCCTFTSCTHTFDFLKVQIRACNKLMTKKTKK